MPRFFAHRGASAAYAENTRAAFLHGLAIGADGLECDVHLSGDGQVVVHHDAVLGRTSNGSGEVRELRWDELRAFDYSSWKGVPLPAEYGDVSNQLLRLTDLVDLALAAGREVEIAVETKHQLGDVPRLEAAVLGMLEARGMDPATRRLGTVTFSFMSFQPEAVRRLAAQLGGAGVCQLIEEDRSTEDLACIQDQARQALDSGLAGLAGPGVQFTRHHEDWIRGWLDAGTLHRVWTVDSLEDATYLLGLGVTELTSNAPDKLRAALLAAGVEV